MVDRVYRGDLPRLRKALAELRTEFARIEAGPAWIRLRIDPLSRHLRRLEDVVPQGSTSGLRGLVPMLHSDLVYLRQNVQALQRVRASRGSQSLRKRGGR